MKEINVLKDIINNSMQIVFFTGAGVSTESNIPDFRSSKGIYKQANTNENPEEMVSRSYFKKNPLKFYRFYKDKLVYPDAKPNDAHIAIAKLEAMGKVKSVITQNIDNLHQMAGSNNVIELHGSVHRNHCGTCGKKYELNYILETEDIPYCSCGGIVEPDVVLFEDPLDGELLDRAAKDIANCDTLIVAGTSLSVYPAASLVRFFRGDNFVIINRDKTGMDSAADLVIRNYVGKVLKETIE